MGTHVPFVVLFSIVDIIDTLNQLIYKIMESPITWEPVQDRHCRGRCELGELWIRLDRAGKVSGIYTLFGETQKWVPESEEEETLSGAKVICELLLAGETAARKIEKIIR